MAMAVNVNVRFPVLAAVVLATAALSATETLPPVIAAVKRGDHQAVHALAANRAEVNRPQADGTTALHWAVQNNDVDMVDMLLRAGADANAANRYGIRPITVAATNGSAAIVEALLKSGVDPNTATEAGEPVLMTAARSGGVDAVKRLLAAGAKVNAREPWFGENALMWAAAENHADVVRTLVAGGADVDARSTVLDPPVLEFPRSGGPNSPFPRGGWTALMYAARQGAIERRVERGGHGEVARHDLDTGR